MWTKYVIKKQGFDVIVYVNKNNTRAVIFPLFGKYFSLSSDKNTLDFTVDFLLGTTEIKMDYNSYIEQNEVTNAA